MSEKYKNTAFPTSQFSNPRDLEMLKSSINRDIDFRILAAKNRSGNKSAPEVATLEVEAPWKLAYDRIITNEPALSGNHKRGINGLFFANSRRESVGSRAKSYLDSLTPEVERRSFMRLSDKFIATPLIFFGVFSSILGIAPSPVPEGLSEGAKWFLLQSTSLGLFLGGFFGMGYFLYKTHRDRTSFLKKNAIAAEESAPFIRIREGRALYGDTH